MQSAAEDIQQTVEVDTAIAEAQDAAANNTDDPTGGTGLVGLASVTSTDNFLAVATPSPEVRDLTRGTGVGTLWNQDQITATADPPTLTAGGLPIGAAYTQAEVVALRDAVITLSDKVRELMGNARSSGVLAP